MAHGEELGGDGISPELRAALARLSPPTQVLLADLVNGHAGDASLDALSLVHGLLSSHPGARAAVGLDDHPAISRQLPFKNYTSQEVVTLPSELLDVSMPLGTALRKRRSHYRFSGRPLDLRALSTLLGSSYRTNRFTTAYGYRRYPLNVAPSAGGLQPVNVYLAAHNVADLRSGVYYYHPYRRTLHTLREGDVRPHLARCLGQPEFTSAPAIIALTCSLDRTLWKYSLRHYRAVHIDTGIVVQNLYLVATALGMGICAIAGYHQDEVHQMLEVDGRMEFATLLVAVGQEPEEPGSAD